MLCDARAVDKDAVVLALRIVLNRGQRAGEQPEHVLESIRRRGRIGLAGRDLLHPQPQIAEEAHGCDEPAST